MDQGQYDELKEFLVQAFRDGKRSLDGNISYQRTAYGIEAAKALISLEDHQRKSKFRHVTPKPDASAA